jgi:hypothetical protein
MIRPPDFDPAKNIGDAIYLFGPHAPQVRNAWLGATEMWYHLLAQKVISFGSWISRTASAKRPASMRFTKTLGLVSSALEDGQLLKTLHMLTRRASVYMLEFWWVYDQLRNDA